MTGHTPASVLAWRARPVDETLAALETSRQGLTAAEVGARLARVGRNVLPPPKRRGPLLRFLLQFHNVLIYLLLAAALVTAAMGMKGTEAAKEAAEIVLADDNFATIAAAVEEVRTIYDNIRKAIVFILPTNGGQAGVLVAAILLGLHQMPITPVQILWVNMVTAVTLALTLAFEPAEADIMRRPPRDPREPVLTPFMLWRVAFVSALLVAGSLGLFLWELARGASLEVARTATVNLLMLGEVFYLFNCRRRMNPVLSWEGLTGNRWVWVAIGALLLLQLAFTYLPWMQTLFHTAALDLAAWGRILAFGVCVLLAVELEKAVVRVLHRRSGG